MEKDFNNEQECFWEGEFGSDYTVRNNGLIHSNCGLFAKILSRTHHVNSILEFGSNIGLNLIAINSLLPNCSKSAVEINALAIEYLEGIQGVEIFNESVLSFNTDRKWDLVLSKGLLIHISPDMLQTVYEKLFSCSRRYILIAEYYSPTPVSIPYRGHLERLFKRDFAGEMLDRYSELHLIDYGFSYHRDPNFPQDDITWFLLGKS